MSKFMKIGIALFLVFVLVIILILLSPFILFGIFGIVGKIQHTIENTIEEKATENAISLIEPFKVDNNQYDISTIIFGISNTKIEYEFDGTKFVIESMKYNMDSSAFNDKCTYWLHSYNIKDNDVQLINDVCKVLNKYDLEYEYVEGYIYRGSMYGEGYVYGSYDESYLHGQYLEITLRPIEGEYTVLRFDLELSPDSVEYGIINDLRDIDNISQSEIPWSIGSLLQAINMTENEKTD